MYARRIAFKPYGTSEFQARILYGSDYKHGMRLKFPAQPPVGIPFEIAVPDNQGNDKDFRLTLNVRDSVPREDFTIECWVIVKALSLEEDVEGWVIV